MSTIYKMLLLLIALFPLAEARGQQLRLALDTASALQSSQVEIALRARNFTDMLSAQGTIAFDPQIVQFDTISHYGLPGLLPSSFSTGMVNAGKLTFSWDDASLQGINLPSDSAVFKLRFVLIGAPGTQSPLHFANSPVPAEFSDTSFTPVPLDTLPGLILVEDTTTVGLTAGLEKEGFAMQVLPNPVESQSVIRLEMQQAEVVHFQLWGMNGSVLATTTRRLHAGTTEIPFAAMFPALPTGLYLLRGESASGRNLIKTMIPR